MPKGTYDLSYSPGRAAVGRTTFDPGAVAEGIGGLDLLDLLSLAKGPNKRVDPNPWGGQPVATRRPMRTEATGGARIGGPFQLMDKLQGMRQDFYGQRIGSNPRFAEMIPAFTASGVDLFGGKPTGWEMYAMLAGTPPADVEGPARASNLQAQTRALEQLGPRQTMGTRLSGMRRR